MVAMALLLDACQMVTEERTIVNVLAHAHRAMKLKAHNFNTYINFCSEDYDNYYKMI
jgi:hypothetical protein